MLRKFSTSDFFLADRLVRLSFAAWSAQFRSERNRFSRLSIQSLDRIGEILACATQGPLALKLLCTNPDVMHQSRETSARQRLAASLCHALRCKACCDFIPRRAILVMHRSNSSKWLRMISVAPVLIFPFGESTRSALSRFTSDRRRLRSIFMALRLAKAC